MVPTDIVNIIMTYVKQFQNLEKQELRLFSCARELKKTWSPPVVNYPIDVLAVFKFRLSQRVMCRFIMRTMKAGYMPQYWVDLLYENLTDDAAGPLGWSTADSLRSWAWEFFHSNTELAFMWQVLPAYVKDPRTYAYDGNGEVFFL